MDMFAFEAWLKECKQIWDAIDKEWPDASDSFQLAMFSKAARPYFYFLEAGGGTTTRPPGPSPFGSERVDAGTAQEREGSATAKAGTSTTPKCTKCKKDFIPRVKSAKICLDCWKKENPRR